MTGNTAGRLRLAFECTVADATTMWDAAALRAAEDFAMSPDAVVETIGPREDPEIEACAMMLFDSLVRHGGVFDAMTVTALRPSADKAAAPAFLAMPARGVADLHTLPTHRAA